MNEKKPRQIAAQILQRQAAAAPGPYTEEQLERALAGPALAPRDRALCQELVCGVVRWRAALDHLIARKTGSRGQKAGLQNLLRLGLYQIFWLDRIPPHAAVHETVEQARQGGFGAQSGFVNAILRGYLREFDATKHLLAQLKKTQPHLGYSHPEWLVERWRKRFGEERTRQLLEWNNTPPRLFARLNALKLGGVASPAGGAPGSPPRVVKNPGELLALWRDENVEYDFVRRDWFPENLVFELKSHPPLGALPSFQGGFFYVQDPSTLLAVHALEPRPAEAVLDLCAAPGGKLSYIAQQMKNEGRLVAHDISRERLGLVQENCARLGVSCVEAILTPTLQSREEFFDRVLVDAPCSNTGVMRRRVDLRWRIQPGELARLAQAQADLLRLAAARLKPGGVLVYSTCSLEPEENTAIVQEFLAGRKDFALETQRELLPFEEQVDGAFVARLKKRI